MKGLAGNEGADTDQHNKQTQDTSCLTTAKLLGGFFLWGFFFWGGGADDWWGLPALQSVILRKSMKETYSRAYEFLQRIWSQRT